MSDIAVKRYAIYLCDECVIGAGGECHTAGCAMWINRAPDIPLDPPMTVPLADALSELIDTPHTGEFFESVRMESAHQVKRWGTEHDEGKEPTDWLWLLGHLAGKAVVLPEKRKHHIISSAAVLLNWYRRETGDSAAFQPGVTEPKEVIR